MTAVGFGHISGKTWKGKKERRKRRSSRRGNV